jgi:hypothetical protein
MTNIFNNAKVWWWTKWVLIPLALVYGWYQFNYPTATFRYKLTAEVMTPEGLKTGSSVIEVNLSHHGNWGNGEGTADTLTGEAVYVDLGHGKNLFVLLGSDRWRNDSLTETGDARRELGSQSALDLLQFVHKLDRRLGEERGFQWRVNKLVDQPPVAVKFTNIPLMGSFADMQKPETFRTLDPDDLKSVLGDGFALKQVTLQIVDERLNTGLNKTLPWLSPNPEPHLSKCSQSTTNRIPCSVSHGSFRADGISSTYIQ